MLRNVKIDIICFFLANFAAENDEGSEKKRIGHKIVRCTLLHDSPRLSSPRNQD